MDDDNAYALGGCAGHAGLFSTAHDVALGGWRILEEIEGADAIGASVVLADFVRPPRAMGFDVPTGPVPSCGPRFGQGGPRGAIGHLGFTGCSLWIDLDRRLSVALLTNRVFPTRQNVDGIKALRPAFHEAVLDVLI